MSAGLDREKIKEQAKAMMDEFIKALDKAGMLLGEVGLDREQTTREAAKTKPEEGFTERMLKNAPKKEGRHIIAEKKSW